MKTVPKYLTELSEARQLEKEQIEAREIREAAEAKARRFVDSLEEPEDRKLIALETIAESLRLIENHLSNISEMELRKK